MFKILGIGRNGHIGFNEPFSLRNSRTRLATLDSISARTAAQRLLQRRECSDASSFTMGVGTILEARKILLVALGEHKAGIIREAVEGPLTDRVPASLLREHADATVLIDDCRSRPADRSGHPLARRSGGVGKPDDQAGRAVAFAADRQGASKARRAGLPRSQSAPPAAASWARPEPGASRIPLDDGHDRVSPGWARDKADHLL